MTTTRRLRAARGDASWRRSAGTIIITVTTAQTTMATLTPTTRGRPGWRGLLAMGAAAGLIPCPSALVVLLGAIVQDQVALGMLLIVAFSAGLAATLTALGLAVVLATRFVRRMRAPAGLVAALPAASAVVIVGVGCVLTARALPLIAA